MFKITTALKEQVKLMIGIVGPAGSGKTFSALQLAYGITNNWKSIAVADTENRSSLYYAGEKTGPWLHVDFPSSMRGGYHPNNWISLINQIESMPEVQVLILDSISHEWQGVGGCLQLLEAYSKNAKGNTFSPWKIVTPLHDAFIDKMRNSRLHIITTMRTSTEYTMEKSETTGKTVPKKVGLKPTQRDGIDYEFGIIFDLEMNHHISCSKDRSGLFIDRPPFVLTPEVGQELLKWTKDGKEVVESKPDDRATKAILAFTEFGLNKEDLEIFFGTPHTTWDEPIFEQIGELWREFKAVSKNKPDRPPEEYKEELRDRKAARDAPDTID